MTGAEARERMKQRGGQHAVVAIPKVQETPQKPHRIAQGTPNKHKKPRCPKHHDKIMTDKGRLPIGSRFHLAYVADDKWCGILTLPNGPMFEASESGLFKTCAELDNVYRRYLCKQMDALKQTG